MKAHSVHLSGPAQYTKKLDISPFLHPGIRGKVPLGLYFYFIPCYWPVSTNWGDNLCWTSGPISMTPHERACRHVQKISANHFAG